MRKLKLQMQVTVDNFVAGTKGELDWMVWDWDEELKNHVSDLTEPADLILLGRKLSENFIDAWESRVKEPETSDEFAQKMVEAPKIVFSKSLEGVKGKNATVNNGDLVEEITKLKNAEGGDIIVYGGAKFVNSLIKHGLIDEYHLFVNPVAIGKGMTIFSELDEKLNLAVVDSKMFPCGIIVLHYTPKAG